MADPLIPPIPTTSPIPPSTTTTPWDPIMPDPHKCNYYIDSRNQTEYFNFSNPYGGIPQNLLINFICWAVLVLLFAVLRRAAGNYGRLALIRKDDAESKWTQVFFSHEDSSSADVEEQEQEMPESESLASFTDWSDDDRGYLSWIKSIFTLSDDKILRKCGTDAVQYIKFQRHLIIFVLIITVICISVILPINFTMGNMQGDKTNFGHTTISNLDPLDNVLWIHIVIAILFMPMGIFIMRRFSVSLRMEEEECVSCRTLMMDGIPRQHCIKDTLIRHLQEAYPSFEIEDVQIAYDVSQLVGLNNKLERADGAIKYSENYKRKNGGKHLRIKPHCCGLVCGLFSCCLSSSVEAEEFYKDEKEAIKHSVEAEKSTLQTKTLGMAFVTFVNLDDAKKVNKDHKKICHIHSSPPTSSLDDILKPNTWDVTFAPPPEDIYWENLDSLRHFRILKVIIINIILFLVLFFFTSPAYIISLLETIPFLQFNSATFYKNVGLNLPSYITDFLPTILLWTLSALLPVIVAYTDWWLGHWRRSVENLWIMRKVFGFLLFMVLILPSIGLTTIRGFVEVAFHNNNSTETFKWKCIFIPDNGAFFINYVTTCALVGTGLEIIRFPELIMYVVRLAIARSQAEISSVRKAIVYEFPFGINYGWILLVFALTVSYSVICPLITPFGLFYMIMKHGVDRYNIYFAYKRSKINKNIHGCAINCVIISLLIQQLCLLFFNTVRNKDEGLLPPRAIFSITMFVIFCLLFLVQMSFHMFKGISPIQYMQGPSSTPTPSTEGPSRLGRSRLFVPDVLRSSRSSQELGISSNPV